MYQFWNTIIAPVLKCTTGTIVEIGALEGANTLNLLKYCQKSQQKLIVVDPRPLFDAEQLKREVGYDFELHLEKSLDTLPQLKNINAVLIDGDHNWHTVYHELQAIAQNHTEPKNFPVVLFHDVSWPYARRDMYYEPENIPAQARKPFAKSGIRYAQSSLAENYHFNGHLDNALEEGGEKNGLLTAIEDFIQQSPINLKLLKLPVFHGFGIMIAHERLAHNEALQACLQRFQSAPFLFELLEELEALRAQSVADLIDQNAKLYHRVHQLESQLNKRGFIHTLMNWLKPKR